MKRFENIVQIAGIKSLQEARLLMECGVDLLGFPLFLKDNIEDLNTAQVAEITCQIKNITTCSVITYLDKSQDIIDICKHIDISTVQLHGDMSLKEIRKLKSKAPYITIIKSLIIGKFDCMALKKQIAEFEPYCRAFITDTFDPQTGACGATGKMHDLNTSRELISLSNRPVIIAGGLTPQNVHDSIMFARPAGVDAHTGVEDSEGNKSEARVKEFVENARNGFAAL